MHCWHIQSPELFEQVKLLVLQNYPTLHVVVENQVVHIRGTLVITMTNSAREIDQFSIEIEFPKDYPAGIPRVKETDGRIPTTADRHFNGDGSACLFFRDARYKYYPKGSDIVYLIEKLVKNFFLWQIDYDANKGISSIGGWGHNAVGVLEFYSELLGSKDVRVIKRFLIYLSKKFIKRHWPCYCRSGRQLRCCHLSHLLETRSKVYRKDAAISFRMIA